MDFKNSIFIHNPDIARQWSILNGFEKFPTTVSFGSHYHAIWECSAGHIYVSEVKSRCVGGNGCPYCNGSRPWRGETDLASQRPDLLAEWDYEKNGDLVPEALTLGSNKKVSWKCSHGHEWKATVCDRTRKGYGCPFCSGKRVISSETDLATLYPSIAAEWHPTKNGTLLPSEVKPFSMKKVYWLCSICGYEWQTCIADRTQGCGCPRCANHIVTAAYNDLQTTNPDLASEWDTEKNRGLLPTMVTSGSGKIVWWKCPRCGYEWKAEIASRSSGKGCPCCANKVVCPDINDLATTNPVLASEWHPTKNGNLTPQMVTQGSGQKVWWRGDCGHEWLSDISNRNKGNGCPVCNGTIALVGETDLATVNPELVEEWDFDINGDLIPQHVTGMSGQLVWWKCKCGHSWQATIANRANGNGCPYCWGRIPVAGETDLLTVNPDLAAEWHPTLNGELTPQMVTSGSNISVWWQCKNDSQHIWNAIVNDRNNGKGCPYCANKKILVGENDLATTNPELAKEWHPTLNGELTPQMVVAGSGRVVWWRCLKNPTHIWTATVDSRSGKESGCPYCANQKILVGDNDLATTNPELAKEWHPTLNGELTPQMVTAGSSQIVWWRCHKNNFHVWKAVVSNRNNGSGCPYCSNQRIFAGENDLATTNPELAKEWHPTLNGELTPQMVSAGSNRTVWWRCLKNPTHVWKAIVGSRSNGSGCPYCCNEAIPGINDLATTNPQIAVEWHPVKNRGMTPQMITASSTHLVWWKCKKCGYAWCSPVNYRCKGQKCPKCTGYMPSVGRIV